MKPVRKISQETFDQAVKDGMEMFEYTYEEAIEEAIKDFNAQSVNLTNIIKTVEWAQGVNEVEDKVKLLSPSKSSEEILPHLNDLKSIVARDMAHKLLAEKHGVYGILMNLLKKEVVPSHHTMEVMATLLDGYPDLMDLEGFELCLENLQEGSHPSALSSALQWTAVSCKMHEANRQTFIKMGLAGILSNNLDNSDEKIVHQVCRVVSLLTKDDDIREEVSRAHNHACLLAEELLHKLTIALQANANNASMFLPLLGAVCSLLVRNEFCEQFADEQGLETVFTGLIQMPKDPKVVRKTFLSLGALAGNDDVKAKIIEKGGAHLISTCWTPHLNSSDVNGAAVDLVGRLSLRSAKNSEELCKEGIAALVCQVMQGDLSNEKLLVTGCRALRNMASRSELVRNELRQLGVGTMMQDITKQHPYLKPDTRSCLKEIDPNFQPDVPLLWTGEHGDKLKHT